MAPDEDKGKNKPEQDGEENDPVLEKALNDLGEAAKKIEEMIEYYI
jgi:hypothetical protein